jgi:hypothetical protein
VLVHLLKDVLYRDRHPVLWRDLQIYRAPVRDYFSKIGLEVVEDEAEGYAFLKQRDEDDEEIESLPKLIQRRPLTYEMSIFCALLRKKLGEHDAEGGGTRTILSREQIIDLVQICLPAHENEAKAVEKIDSHIKKAQELGLLRQLKGEEDRYEIQRIIKALVPADWLKRVLEKMSENRTDADSD